MIGPRRAQPSTISFGSVGRVTFTLKKAKGGVKWPKLLADAQKKPGEHTTVTARLQYGCSKGPVRERPRLVAGVFVRAWSSLTLLTAGRLQQTPLPFGVVFVMYAVVLTT